MAKVKEQKAQKEVLTFPVTWHIPDDLVARYATNMVVQRLENEYLISFFEIKPPIILGNPEEISEQAKDIKDIKATCVAQIIVAAEKMPNFIHTLEENFIKASANKTEK